MLMRGSYRRLFKDELRLDTLPSGCIRQVFERWWATNNVVLSTAYGLSACTGRQASGDDGRYGEIGKLLAQIPWSSLVIFKRVTVAIIDGQMMDES